MSNCFFSPPRSLSRTRVDVRQKSRLPPTRLPHGGRRQKFQKYSASRLAFYSQSDCEKTIHQRRSNHIYNLSTCVFRDPAWLGRSEEPKASHINKRAARKQSSAGAKENFHLAEIFSSFLCEEFSTCKQFKLLRKRVFRVSQISWGWNLFSFTLTMVMLLGTALIERCSKL